ncbi:MAG: hypothetical protein GY725_00860 [bacterium]|nr:hypothetical protein [bacterium]
MMLDQAGLTKNSTTCCVACEACCEIGILDEGFPHRGVGLECLRSDEEREERIDVVVRLTAHLHRDP